MDQIKLTKNNVIKALNSSGDFHKELDSFFKDTIKVSNVPNEIKNTFLFRKDNITEILRALNSNKQNLYLLGGFQGTGKTTFLKSVELAIDSNIMFFYYECSFISNLDDMILALYNYLVQFSFKETKLSRFGKTNQSIDEKLINILNNIDRPLVIVLDGFENILKDYSEIKDYELKKFLDFILSIQYTKLILAGKKVPALSFKNVKANPLTIRLGGLEKEECSTILKNYGIILSESIINGILETTRGYPENIKLFATAVNMFKILPSDILRECNEFDDSFESYIFQKIYTQIPDHCKEIVNLLATIHHPVNIQVLDNFKLFNELKQSIKYLKQISVLSENNGEFYIKDYFKNIIYTEIPEDEKLKLHSALHELYKDQIDKPLKERILSISKNLLYSEKYHHYNILTKVKKKQKPESPQQNPMLISSYYNNKYDLTYLPKNVNEIVTSKSEDTGQSTKKTPSPKIYEDNLVFGIGLTEEEMSLLDEEFIFEGQLVKETEEEQKKQESKENNNAESLEKTPEILKTEYLNYAKNLEAQGKAESAINYYKKAANILTDLREFSTVAELHIKIAELYNRINKQELNIEYLLKAISLYTNINDLTNVALLIFKIAESYNSHYKHEMALKYFYMILNTDYPVPENLETKALVGIGDIYDYRKDYNMALKFYLKALDKVRFYDDIETKCVLSFKAALIYDEISKVDKALIFYQKSLDFSKDPRLNQFLSAVYSNMAVIYEEIGKKSQAIKFYIKSLEVDKELNYYEGQYKTLSILANIYFEQGNKEKTLYYLSEGIHSAKLSGDEYCIAMSYLDIGDYYLSQKVYSKAIISFIKAKKAIGQVISTDSKEKIDRRFKQIIMEIGEKEFNRILEGFRKKNE